MAYRRHLRSGCLWMSVVVFGLAPIPTAAESATTLNACAGLEGKALRWIIPYPPGGGYDVLSRLIGPHLKEELGVEVRFDHIVGASGLVAAKNLQSAPPDGRTLALLDGNACLRTVLFGENVVVHPLKDLTLLCRLSRDRRILLTNRHSPFGSADDLIEIGRTRQVVFAAQSLSDSPFVIAAMLKRLFGIRYRVIPNYAGSKAIALATMQNEVDMASLSTSRVIAQYVESGELLPVLRLSEQPYPGVEWYNELPHLDGRNGLAVRFAEAYGGDTEEAEIDAAALSVMGSSTRIVFGPPGMEKKLAECLEDALVRALRNPVFNARARKAGSPPDVAGSTEASADFTFLEKRGKAYADYLKREAEPLK